MNAPAKKAATPAQMVEMYVKLRDHKRAAEEAFKSSMERVNLALEKLGNDLLQHLNDAGADSIKAKSGTVYKSTTTNCSVEDRDAFLEYVQTNELWDALDVKANKTFVKEQMDAGNAIPPGVKVSQFVQVGVRRAS